MPNATKAAPKIKAVRLLNKSANKPDGSVKRGPDANCFIAVSVPISTLLKPNPDFTDGIITGHSC